MARSFQSRTILLCSTLVVGLSALSYRLIDLQLVNRHLYAEKADRSYTSRQVLPARRGLLVDRHDEILARNLPVSTVVADRYHLRDPRLGALGLAYDRLSRDEYWPALDADTQRSRIMDERRRILDQLEPYEIVSKHLAYAIGVLARPLGLRREEMRQLIEDTEKMDVPLVKDLPEDIADRLEDVIKEHWIQGFRFERSLRRWYTAPQLAGHVIGFTDGENVGRFGAEVELDSYLAGRDGHRTLKRDPRGLLMPAHAGELLPPRAGLNVQLTLDMGIQAIVEEELERGLIEFESRCGAVVLMDPHTGEVLAMATRPHFDLNRLDNLDEASLNYATQAVYEPGSTFKIIGVAGALDAGLVTPQTPIFCHYGYYHEGDVVVRDHHPYGTLTVSGVIQKSSNPGAYLIARQLGRKRWFEAAGRLGFGRRTGIRLSGETRGRLVDTENAVDFSRVSFGYAVNVTPLQVACAYSAVANGGMLMRPRIARQVVANDGTVIERFPPQAVGRAMKERTSERLRVMLESVVDEEGTARRAAVPGFRAGGKTGTTKKVRTDGRGYMEGRYTVSFVGMLPANDPEFVCVVVVDDPQTDVVRRYGGTIAAPIFSRIAGRTAAHMNLEPTEPVEEEEAQLASGNNP